MQEFFLLVRGRYIRILLDDVLGADGSVPTLVCHEAPTVQVIPTEVEPAPRPWYPPFPAALRREIELDVGVEPPAELKVDLSGLSAGAVPFALEVFAEKAAAELDSGVRSVEIGPANAHEWGLQGVEA